ncbi:LysR family transcriptional regulator [Nesterenkonia sp. CL21]|uniref:LysR family transcriptional regulator n=1 Tax=Nesterenkonia sp. CL21 TaxID=3064894 RepID=UPI0028785108|nr:LysR family transcriptional regulator [Nesterenkonia sp. CL21]MDS2174315.1 LysR family transcriptional regulator [Nesterenkonia sp. CL21]
MQNPHRLQMLEAVIASGSVQAAARNLNYSPATVSQHLKQLARETGLELFTREGRGIVPTEAARELVAHASGALTELRRLDRTIADLRESPAEHLAVACFSSAAQVWLPGVIEAVRAHHPQVTVEVSLNEPYGGHGRRHADLDIRNEPLDDPPEPDAPRLEGYERHPLAVDAFFVVLPPGHRLADRDVIPLQELQDEPWIDHDIYDSPTGRIISTACRAAGFAPGYVARLDDHHAALALVEAGIGLTVLPRLALTGVEERLPVRGLTAPEVRRRIVVHVRRAPQPRPVVQRALQTLMQLSARG